MSSIHIYYQAPFKHKIKAGDIKKLIKYVFKNEIISFKSLNIIFCSDDFLLKINRDFLKHDTYTDIITFNYGNAKIEGEIYISGERLLENAKNLTINYHQEILRLIIHGILHLCGHLDRTKKDKIRMTRLENFYLNYAFIAVLLRI